MGTQLAGILGAGLVALLAASAPAEEHTEDDRGLACRSQVSAIESGFGAAGPHPVSELEIPHPGWPERKVTLFRPVGTAGKVPVVFFSHGFGATDPVHYQGLLEHLASRGLAVVYAPYRSVAASHDERYEMLWEGFAAAAAHGADWLDLERIGFLGHSFGGGATPAMARRGLLKHGWGGSGAFVMVMAPWYVLQVDAEDLAALPPHTRILIQVYEHERVNDHRIAHELFEALGERDAKSFVLIRSDRHGTCRLRASHTTPATHSVRGHTDGLDRHGVFRLVDALAAAAFDGDADAQALLFPAEQRRLSMGRWPDGTPVTPALIGPPAEPSRGDHGYYFGLGSKERWMRATELEF